MEGSSLQTMTFDSFLQNAGDHVDLLFRAFALLGYVVKGSPRILPAQQEGVRRLMEAMALSPELGEQALERYRYGQSEVFDPKGYFLGLLAGSSIGQGLLRAIVYIAVADGKLSGEKKKRIGVLAGALSVSRDWSLQVAEYYRQKSADAIAQELQRQKDAAAEERERQKQEKAEAREREREERERQKLEKAEAREREREERERQKLEKALEREAERERREIEREERA
nr:hypothetical protein [Succinivibrionaceae bacterium]